MKTLSNGLSIAYAENGDMLVTFNVRNPRSKAEILDLKRDSAFNVELTVKRSKRSLKSNNFLWAILEQMEKKSEEDIMSWYCKALEESNAKYTYRLIADDDNEIKMFKKDWRATSFIGKRTIITAKNTEVELLMYKCFYGSSKMNVKEMNKLLDIIIKWAYELDIDVEPYREE